MQHKGWPTFDGRQAIIVVDLRDRGIYQLRLDSCLRRNDRGDAGMTGEMQE
jgi:hypothetical protein